MRKLLLSSLTVILFLFVTSCGDSPTSNNVTDSLELVDDVELIAGAESTAITVYRSQQTYFEINFSEINSNNIIQNGALEGWCIDWEKPIDSNGGVYTNLQLYSTYNVKSWKPINYLFNIIEQLKQDDPGITFREVQTVIWSLRGNPEFDLNKINIQDLPGRMHENGEPLFNQEKVDFILGIVEAGYRDFVPTSSSRFAVIAETPADIQTVIAIVN